MQILEYISILRRRWFYVALALLVGAVAGFVTAPGASDETEAFQATHRLLVDPNSPSGQTLNLEQTELIVTNGAVPERVDEQLAEAGMPGITRVTADADVDVRSLTITAYSTTSAGAEAAANFFAEGLNTELVGAEQSALDRRLASASDRVEEAQGQLTAVDRQLSGLAPEDPARTALQDRRSSLSSTLAEAQVELQAAEAAGPITPPLRTLEAGEGGPAVTEGWQIPESKPVRGAMLGLFGLMLGAAGALAADRLDTRVRGKEDAERAFDLPVVAEVPPIPAGTKSRELLVSTRPSAPFVEAYRALRTVVLFAAETKQDGLSDSGATRLEDDPDVRPPAVVVLITSPSAGEGKTTTVAHLAAVMAEFGKKVLVVSADFRRPRIHELFGVEREPGLSDVLEAGTHRVRLSDLQMKTNFDGVHLLPSGGPVDNPAQLLGETRQLIAAARSLFDYVLIDTPPLLVANDATELAAVADMVVLMAKADRTSRDSARRATEILRRVDAPLLGVVVAAAHDTPTAYGYYRYRYYAEADQGGGRRARRARSKALSEPTPAKD